MSAMKWRRLRCLLCWFRLVQFCSLGLIEGRRTVCQALPNSFLGSTAIAFAIESRWQWSGYFVTASAMASFAVATQWWHVLAGRVTGWIGRGARSPVRAVLLTESTSPDTYGRAFGFERAMDSAGAVIGPVLSLFWLRQWACARHSS